MHQHWNEKSFGYRLFWPNQLQKTDTAVTWETIQIYLVAHQASMLPIDTEDEAAMKSVIDWYRCQKSERPEHNLFVLLWDSNPETLPLVLSRTSTGVIAARQLRRGERMGWQLRPRSDGKVPCWRFVLPVLF